MGTGYSIAVVAVVNAFVWYRQLRASPADRRILGMNARRFCLAFVIGSLLFALYGIFYR